MSIAAPESLRHTASSCSAYRNNTAKKPDHGAGTTLAKQRRVGLAARAHASQYERHRPELTTLYEVVSDNLETLYGAIDDGALDIKLPKHAKKELEAYLDCGLLCRGFARLRCGSCDESHLVAFSCKGRGFCPSCMGRRMCATAANLMERVLPEVDVRQWVLTFPFAWRKRLAMDGTLRAHAHLRHERARVLRRARSRTRCAARQDRIGHRGAAHVF